MEKRPVVNDSWIALRMPNQLHQRILKYALRKQVPLSRAVRDLVTKGLGRQ